ncbi:MAG: hypothetical protein JNM57_11285 [Cyclobacteriaceae bacterium]|nr:hypothetical protein [Cyclobacteriaceae bacterium]
MKRSVFSFLILAAGFLMLQSCDNGNADVTIFDSPPAIDVIKPVNVTSSSFNLKVKFSDGAVSSISSSPLKLASYQILDSDDEIVEEGPLTVSGVITEVTEALSLESGSYKLVLLAEDTNGNEAADTTAFKVVGSVGIIGDAVGGWGSDVNLTKSATDPDVYTLPNYTIGTGQVKFRADDDWAVNWGGTAFPEGTGTQDGDNITVTPGTYTITIDISTGKYSFK